MSWLLKLEMVCYDLVFSRCLFHATDAAVAKPLLAMAFLGWTKETILEYQPELDETKLASKTLLFGSLATSDKMYEYS